MVDNKWQYESKYKMAEKNYFKVLVYFGWQTSKVPYENGIWIYDLVLQKNEVFYTLSIN